VKCEEKEKSPRESFQKEGRAREKDGGKKV